MSEKTYTEKEMMEEIEYSNRATRIYEWGTKAADLAILLFKERGVSADFIEIMEWMKGNVAEDTARYIQMLRAAKSEKTQEVADASKEENQ